MLIDGKSVAQQIKEAVKRQVAELVQKTSIHPALATVLVGEDPASQVYVKNKIKACEQCGIKSIHQTLKANTSEAELLALVHSLNADKNVHGILVQFPLPKHINANTVLQAINPNKDVDGFHPYNLGLLMSGQRAPLEPCTPAGVMELLKHYQIPVAGKDVLIVGRSNIMGKPMALMMIRDNATVTVAHSQTVDLAKKVSTADIVVAAIGKPQFIKGDWIKEGAVVIDVGINRKNDGTICGDVDFIVAESRASFITPVPGGVGPMTIAMLMGNTVRAATAVVRLPSSVFRTDGFSDDRRRTTDDK